MIDKIEENYQKLWDFSTGIEHHVTTTLTSHKKMIQNSKFELVEILDTKHENMQRQFDNELLRVKEKYESAVLKVDEASTKLAALFKKKVITIKEKSALFFAKMEMKLKESNDDVLLISNMFRNWQETLQGPTQKFESQIFTLNKVVGLSEKEREGEFGMLKEVVSHLVHALEDKTTTDIINFKTSN